MKKKPSSNDLFKILQEKKLRLFISVPFITFLSLQ